MKTSSALLAIVGLGLLTFWAAASMPADEVARVVRAEMANQQIPGLALLVARNGVPIRSEGYGLANVELKVPVKPGNNLSIRVDREAIYRLSSAYVGRRRQDPIGRPTYQVFVRPRAGGRT